MAEKMNICIISREFPPDTAFGGIATFSIDTALMLKAHGHNVTVFSQSLGPSCVTDYHGVQVHKIQIPKPFGSYRFLPLFILAFNLAVYRSVMKCHRELPFDLIDVPDHLAEGLFATNFSNIPVVTRLHTPYTLITEMGLNDYKKGFSYFLIRAMEKRALRKSTVLYAPCMDMVRRCNDLFTLGSIPFSIFGYPLDLTVFSPGIEKNRGPLRILFLGRLEQRKGIETMAAAFPKVVARHPGTTLTLLGRDTPNIQGFTSARKYLESNFNKNGCADAVRFAEYVPLEQLPEVFHNHDIVWAPSMYDNYPLVCLEAMACGKPVVASDVGGLSEIIQHGETGLLFPVGDDEALARETSALCASNELRQHLSTNARNYATEHCSPDVIYKETLELYRFALDKRTGKTCL